MRPHVVVLVVLVTTGCGSSAPPPTKPAPVERSRSTCEEWLRHTLEIEKQAAIELAKHGDPGSTASYDEIRQRPDFLDYCRRHPDAYVACAMRATTPSELRECEPLLGRTPAPDVPEADDPEAEEPAPDEP